MTIWKWDVILRSTMCIGFLKFIILHPELTCMSSQWKIQTINVMAFIAFFIGLMALRLKDISELLYRCNLEKTLFQIKEEAFASGRLEDWNLKKEKRLKKKRWSSNKWIWWRSWWLNQKVQRFTTSMSSMKVRNGFKISTSKYGMLIWKIIFMLSSNIFNEKMESEQQ